MNTQPVISKRLQSPKNKAVAIILQCSPLLTVAGCTSMGFDAKLTSQLNTILTLSVFFAWLVWGLGYAYIGRWGRFAVAFLLGPVFVLTSCYASMSGVNPDFEHGLGMRDPGFQRACLQQAIIIGAVTLLVIVDTWRLTYQHNAEYDAWKVYSRQAEPDPEMDELLPTSFTDFR